MMREIIRFVWGTNSLCDFMVAISTEGIVALEFNSLRTTTEEGVAHPLSACQARAQS